MNAATTRLGVVFGSRSVEHEVSIITACQLMRAVPPTFNVVPLYIDKQGRWWTGDVLKKMETFRSLDLMNPVHDEIQPLTFSPDPTEDHGVDVVMVCTHGSHGEDGTLAGLFELADIPYAAPGVVAAAVAIDKIITKHVAQQAGLAVTPYVWFTQDQWQADAASLRKQIEPLGLPLFVKPASLGSSVGVTRVTSLAKLEAALELVFAFSDRVLVEAEAADCIEVNVSVSGWGGQAQASTTEQPVASDAFLSYADKYERGGKKSGGMASLSRRIPAPIAPSLAETIQEQALLFWRLIDGSGVARIDFFANPTTEEVFIGEVNAPPGSMAFYLWEASGVPYPELITQLVADAQRRHKAKHTKQASIASNILQEKKRS